MEAGVICVGAKLLLFSRGKADADFDVVTEPEISSVVFRLSPSFCAKLLDSAAGSDADVKKSVAGSSGESCDDVNKRVRRALIHKQGVVIGQTVCGGNVYLKFTLLNPLLTYEKLESLLKLIKSLA